jgi:hypothetical protein
MLSRGTGSFVVHGKKASVINFGSELASMSNEEKLRARKQSQHIEQPMSPALSNGDDDEFYSVAGDPPESEETASRRGSAASASTATARSFRELHRKFSSAHASRSVSNSAIGRLTIPSDGESEAAVSFSDGRRSPLPPIETEGEEDEEAEDNEKEITSKTDQKAMLEEGVKDEEPKPPEDATALDKTSNVQPVNA